MNLAILMGNLGNDPDIRTLDNGDKYIFEDENAVYKVLTPTGWSDKPAVQSVDGNRRLFYWEDLVMMITGGPEHGNY